MRKIVGISVIAALVMSFFVFPVSADGFSVLSTTPQNGQRLVSAIDDAVITFSAEVDETTMAGNITVSPAAAFTLKKLGTKVMVLFGSQLDYLTEYTVSVGSGLRSKGGDAVTPMSFTFKTEYDPIKTLYYNDFENGADSLAKFTIGENERAVTAADGFYSIEADPSDPSNHVLHMTPVSYAGQFGYYPIFKDSKNWIWYHADYSLKQGDSSRIRFLLAGGNLGKIVSNPSDVSQRNYTLTLTAINQNARYCKAVNESTNGAVEMIQNQSIGTNNYTKFTPASTERLYSGGSTQVTQTITNVNGTQGSLSGTGYMINGSAGLFAIAEGNQANDSWVDDIIVTDLGWYPQASTYGGSSINRKNIENGTIKLYFENNIYEHTGGSQSITVKDEQGNIVDRTVTVVNDYPRHVKIEITDPKPYTTYTITVPQDSVKRQLANDTYAGFLANDKVFTVKTPYVDPPVYSEPVEQEAGVMTFDDAQNTYSRAFSVDNIDEWENYNSLIVKQDGGEARGKSFEKLGIGGLSGSGTVGFIISGLPTPNTTSIRFTDKEIE